MNLDKNKIPTLPVALVVVVILLLLLRGCGGVILQEMKEKEQNKNQVENESLVAATEGEKEKLTDKLKKLKNDDKSKNNKEQDGNKVTGTVTVEKKDSNNEKYIGESKYYREIDDNLGVGVLKASKGFVKNKTVVVFPGEQLIQRALILGLPDGDLKFMVSGAVYSAINVGDLLNINYWEYQSGGEVFYLVESVNKIEVDKIP